MSSRTVENWLSGSTEPRASHLIELMRHFSVVVDDVLERAERKQGGLTHAQKQKLLEVLGESNES